MNRGKFILVLGGARSGKSEFAENLASGLGTPVIYVATAAAGDEEMSRRIEKHRLRRPSQWRTVEESLRLPEIVERYGAERGVLLIDCLTVWLTNLLLDDNIPFPRAGDPEKEEYIHGRVGELSDRAAHSQSHVIIVANEVGLGIVPAYPLGRIFRDLAGRANRSLAAMADEVYLVTAGLAMEIKSKAVNNPG